MLGYLERRSHLTALIARMRTRIPIKHYGNCPMGWVSTGPLETPAPALLNAASLRRKPSNLGGSSMSAPAMPRRNASKPQAIGVGSWVLGNRIAFGTLLFLTAGLPTWFGFKGYSVAAPIILALGSIALSVLIGWRIGNSNTAIAIGCAIATVFALIFFFIGGASRIL
jgi:hypothetical protein